jgi:Right handed beta helix region
MNVRLSVLLSCLALCSCGGSDTSSKSGITIVRSSPTNLSSATSPVTFSFTASSSQPISGWSISVDGAQVYQTGAISQIETSVPMASGNHSVTVRASNRKGATSSSDFTLTIVSSSGPTPTPTPLPVPAPTPLPTPAPNPSPVMVSISPTTLTLQAGQSGQFTASVIGASNSGVTWLVNGTQGGDSNVGTISSSGSYRAPATSSTLNVTVTAQSVSDPAVSAHAAVTVTAQSAPSGLNYYVAPGGSDANDGSAAHPWATLQHGADSAKPGATVHVAPGNYPVVTSNVAGTSSARIRFVSDVKWGAQIKITNTDAGWQNNADFVDIEGFDVYGSGRLGIANNASSVRIIGNHVHNLSGGSCNSSGGAAIDNESFTGHDNDIIANVVNDIGPTPLGSCSTIQGIYHSNLRGHIYNNIAYRVSGWAIHLWHAANNVTISNNLTFNNGGPTVGGGILVGDGDSPGGVTDDNTIVTNNVVIHNGGRGIEEFGNVGANNVYSNNMVYQNFIDFQLIGKSDSRTLHLDPQFVNYQPDGTGDYHLTPTSPAVNAGTSQGAPANDFDGGARPVGNSYDIGPYEFGSTAASWPFE